MLLYVCPQLSQQNGIDCFTLFDLITSQPGAVQVNRIGQECTNLCVAMCHSLACAACAKMLMPVRLLF
jgi:hypothetical protein